MDGLIECLDRQNSMVWIVLGRFAEEIDHLILKACFTRSPKYRRGIADQKALTSGFQQGIESSCFRN
jgi:hypothetical protein